MVVLISVCVWAGLTRTLGVVAGASLGSMAFVAAGGSATASTAQFQQAFSAVFAGAGGVVVLAMVLLLAITRQRQ